MFTGIVEAVGQTLQVSPGDQSLRVQIEKPNHFNDLNIGDSICCNGVCLTLEEQSSQSMAFALGYETLQLTGWGPEDLSGVRWNLERSLRFGDRVHGHLVSGHVDSMARVESSYAQGDSWILSVQVPAEFQPYVWKKSSLTIQGVSLTVNQFKGGVAEVCLVPETLKKTNLGNLKIGDFVTIETDYYVKGMLCTVQKNS